MFLVMSSATIGADAIQLSVIGGMPVSEMRGVYAELVLDLWDADLTYSKYPWFMVLKVKMEPIFFMASALIFH